MTTHTVPRLDQNSTGRTALIRAGSMADGSACLGDFRSVTAELLWYDLTKDDSSLSQCQRRASNAGYGYRYSRFIRAAVSRSSTAAQARRKAASAFCCACRPGQLIVIAVASHASAAKRRYRSNAVSKAGKSFTPVGTQTFQVSPDEIALRSAAHLRFQAGGH